MDNDNVSETLQLLYWSHWFSKPSSMSGSSPSLELLSLSKWPLSKASRQFFLALILPVEEGTRLKGTCFSSWSIKNLQKWKANLFCLSPSPFASLPPPSPKSPKVNHWQSHAGAKESLDPKLRQSSSANENRTEEKAREVDHLRLKTVHSLAKRQRHINISHLPQ